MEKRGEVVMALDTLPLLEKRGGVVMALDILPLLAKGGEVVLVKDSFPLLDKGSGLGQRPYLFWKQGRGGHSHRHRPSSGKVKE